VWLGGLGRGRMRSLRGCGGGIGVEELEREDVVGEKGGRR
jgi:hypothetical protein